MSFISEIVPHAKRIQSQYHILASLMIAQAILESNWGKSRLAAEGKNLFGVKGIYKGQSVTMKTWEVVKGKSVQVDAEFRKYPSWYESFEDLAKLYTNGVSWDRNKYKAIIGETGCERAAKAVQAAGYATDPAYAEKLIRIISQNNLTVHDAISSSAGAVRQIQQFHLKRTVPGYYTAADAKASISPRGEVKAGIYHIYHESKGMINVTVNEEIPGSWINPADHVNASEERHHTVVKGDTVFQLAVKYQTTMDNIRLWNNLQDINKIYIGQILRVK